MIAAFKPIVFVAGRIIDDFEQSLSNIDDFQYLLNKNGWVVDNISPSQLELVRNTINISDSVEQIKDLLGEIKASKDNFDNLWVRILPIIQNTYQIIDNIRNISSGSFSFFPFNQPNFWTEFGTNLFDTFFSKYLKIESKVLFSVLFLSDIITETTFYPTGDKRIPYKKYKINWSQLGLLVTKPQNLIHAAYNWGDSSGLDYDKVLSKLNTVLNLYGGNAERILIDKPNHERFYLHNPQLSNFNIEQLNISVLQYWEPFINNYKELNLNIIPVPKNDLSQTIDGLALQLAKAGTYESSFMLSPSFYASIDSELDKSDYLLLKILPDSSQFLTNFTASNFNTEFNFTYLPQPSVLLFGTRATSRLEFM